MRTPNIMPKTRERATNLYYEIEKHFALGGGALTLRDLAMMLGAGSKNVGLARHYAAILQRWQLIERKPNTYRTILLSKTNFPPVEWRHIHIKGLQ